jgi:hypothetical protein
MQNHKLAWKDSEWKERIIIDSLPCFPDNDACFILVTTTVAD